MCLRHICAPAGTGRAGSGKAVAVSGCVAELAEGDAGFLGPSAVAGQRGTWEGHAVEETGPVQPRELRSECTAWQEQSLETDSGETLCLRLPGLSW